MRSTFISTAAVLAWVGLLSSCGNASTSPPNERGSNGGSAAIKDAHADVPPLTGKEVSSSGQHADLKGQGKQIPDSAIEKRFSSTYNECKSNGDAANGVTSAMMDCNSAEIELQDARLNQAYKMVMSRLPESDKGRVKASEKVWISNRDRDCTKSMGDEAGGSLGQIIYSGCILDETIKRTVWLESQQDSSKPS